MSSVPPDGRPLPAGWEFKYDQSGRMFFIDHSTRSTTYTDPRTAAPSGAPPSYHSSASTPSARPPPTNPYLSSASAPSAPYQPPTAYPPQQAQAYPPQQAQAYPPPKAQAYPPQQQAYPPQQQAYPPQQQAYPPQQQAYPPQQQAYPPPPSGYPAGPSAYPPQRPQSSAEKRAAAEAAFRLYDADRSGFVDQREFYNALLYLGLQITWPDALAIFAIIDVDGNGTVSLNEFVQHYVANY